ncbi:MAG: hypothetical protein AB7O57_14835 [Hyphomicrobiaceae bacterium]
MAMSADEYRAKLAALGFPQERFAVVVGASPRTGQKWALGETRIPGCVALLLRLLELRPELVSVVNSMTPPPTRARTPSKAKKPGRAPRTKSDEAK